MRRRAKHNLGYVEHGNWDEAGRGRKRGEEAGRTELNSGTADEKRHGKKRGWTVSVDVAQH